ncbi:enoyl-CoA hydratase/isomerase family protein [Sphingopyxis macrogoltabida]|nr:enoyl-CoA hydratase/isomerase family protein [Sphingopyxis macrogoltabida]ALJ16370.1 hypothetical protein LH19_26575 [Sphingopyxis macrogoltabida]
MSIANYRTIRVSESDGVMEAVLHTDGAALIWNGRAGFELTQLFEALSAQSAIKVLILTGVGETFCADSVTFDFNELKWRDVWAGQQRMLGALMNLNIIVIAAVNGPVHYHPEIPMLADIVLASPDTEFAELGHFPRGMVPGDGAQLVMASRLGEARVGYFYLMEERIMAEEARRLGCVHEIHKKNALMPRARKMAAQFARRPEWLITYTKAALRLRDRHGFQQMLSHGMSIEGLAMYAAGMSGKEVD